MQMWTLLSVVSCGAVEDLKVLMIRTVERRHVSRQGENGIVSDWFWRELKGNSTYSYSTIECMYLERKAQAVQPWVKHSTHEVSDSFATGSSCLQAFTPYYILSTQRHLSMQRSVFQFFFLRFKVTATSSSVSRDWCFQMTRHLAEIIKSPAFYTNEEAWQSSCSSGLPSV